MGDGILTMPVLCALRRQFPDATLGWVAEPGAAQLLRGHDCLDELIVVPKGWLKWPAEVMKLRRRLKLLQFDTFVDPQGLSRSAIIGWLSGARKRIGFAPPFGRELAPWMNNVRVARTIQHVVPGNLQLLAPLGITSPEVEFRVPVNDMAESRVDQFTQQYGLSSGYAVLNPGAGWESKRWPQERFAVVASHLWRRWGLRSVVVWAGAQERAWAEEIVAAADGASVLAFDTSMPELASVLRRSQLFAGSDTGPLHLAAAVGVTCVGLYGPTSPEVCGPFGSQHKVVQPGGVKDAQKMRRADGERMRQIQPAAVLAACDQVLQRNQAATA